MSIDLIIQIILPAMNLLKTKIPLTLFKAVKKAFKTSPLGGRNRAKLQLQQRLLGTHSQQAK